MLSPPNTQALVANSLTSTKCAKNVDVDPGLKTTSDKWALLEIRTIDFQHHNHYIELIEQELIAVV